MMKTIKNRGRRPLPLGIVLAMVAGCGETPPPAAPQTAAPPAAVSPAAVNAARLLAADTEPGNWLTHGRTYAEQRFSPLAQINAANVGELGLAWYFDLDTYRGVEATPLVIDGVMYTTSAWSILYALDAKTGEPLWEYDPQVPKEWGQYACCDVVNRGAAAWEGKIYVGTLDGRLVAVDAATGNLLWEVLTIDPAQPYTVTGAPRVINGKIVIGNAGAEYGVRGYVTAYDAETGAQIWRFYTVPGDPAQGFESPTMAMAAGTWTGEWWKYGGGGTAWDALVYDPELNFLYIGTGNGSPWPRDIRSPGGGDNLFLSSIVAVDADTGEYRWHYQTTPADNWDYTATQPLILADLTIDDRPRRVIMQAPKNGFFYVLDRATGELLSAEKFVPTVTWASHVDRATGRPVENTANLYGEDTVLVLPGPLGAHSWQPMSFSPLTGLVYIPAHVSGYPYSADPSFRYVPGRPNLGMNPDGGPPINAGDPSIATNIAALIAWDPLGAQEVWRIAYASAGSGGVLTTAGDLLVQGVIDGRFVIYRASDGTELWSMPVQTGVVAGPIAYSVDGEQFIAVSAGWGGISSLTGTRPQGGAPIAPARMLAFKLGGNASLPPVPPRAVPVPPPLEASADTVARGELVYVQHCLICHGAGAISGGSVPDLRMMTAETHAQFEAIVLEGIRGSRGMVAFADLLSPDDARAVHAYVIKRANEDFAAAPKSTSP
jgi:PQQ-dependent dehydrogenase (methanol/ethanol family)